MTRTLLILTAASAALTVAGFYYHPALGLFMLGGMVLIGLSIWNGGQKMLALYRAREGEGFDTFLTALPDVDPAIARAVYDTIQHTCSSAKNPLPLRPSDHVIDDLMLDLEELFSEVLPRIITQTRQGSPEGLTDLTVGGIAKHLQDPAQLRTPSV
ncbi:hypothetical protein XMM379_002322 [Aliiroseovarius sp. xm-m-379]|uniref:hypothetical protein n=1 Tax=unclassified Aliiroseovarius TaxID=2623558 RepID=UPI0015696B17|nr:MULTISPECIES: hypothetical protein [unclassified Aliiroseovarius]NRP13733.1 hypothetical protein [Aliiroseovarius sp. xm-d-517]NRP25623.1 hypothetical protein [Aliiroseovarius sp. xm-m-379]NRP29616.1 hypothetical protein [Aliiroseovarius sp. xm-m-314]NRP34422.1 hypothetical protein [Aliiroseovarius sp. xm-a-104]NRP41620.1 hypothetical protein [Aliiroseovarius sp. xm-m-339-2]